MWRLNIWTEKEKKGAKRKRPKQNFISSDTVVGFSKLYYKKCKLQCNNYSCYFD